MPADAPDGMWSTSIDIQGGNPGELSAPDEPGTYELRYVLRSGSRILARKSIEVVEGAAD